MRKGRKREGWKEGEGKKQREREQRKVERKEGEMGKRKERCKKIISETGKTAPQFIEIVT